MTTQRTLKRAAFAASVALLFALHVLFAGVASAATGGAAGFFGETCQSQNSAPKTSDTPAQHRHGLCCIVHSGALAEPAPGPVAIVVLRHSSPPAFQTVVFNADVRIASPELAPLSARAPPHRV
jgi:hypothetical protein